MWFVGVEVEQETSAPPPKKNPGSAPGIYKLRPHESGPVSCKRRARQPTPPPL